VKIKLLLLMAIGSILGACTRGDLATKEDVTERFRTFESDPGEKALRALLNVRTDGEVSYLHMALIGKAFAQQPDLFRAAATNLGTEMERRSFRWLAESGDAVFEYYPDHEPQSFDQVFQDSAWLKSHQSLQTKGS